MSSTTSLSAPTLYILPPEFMTSSSIIIIIITDIYINTYTESVRYCPYVHVSKDHLGRVTYQEARPGEN